MSIEQNSPALPQGGTAYGRIIRERGTLRLVIIAGLLGFAWFIYSTIHENMLRQVHWPVLTAEPQGLTVLGLRDKNRQGWRRKYIAIESNHAWQIRRPEEDEGSEPEVKPEQVEDRGADPGASHHVTRGSAVSLEEVMKNCPVVLTGKSFASSNITTGYEPFLEKSFWKINLELTPEGRSRYWQFSREHEGERLVFVLKDEIVTCAQMDNMDVSTLTISPIWIKEDAEKLVNFINSQK